MTQSLRAGRAGHRWRTLQANLRMQRRPCHLCQQAIDYRLRYPHPDSFSVDHVVPLSEAPHLAEDPANLAASHLRCNVSRGARDPKPTLGATSRQW